MISAPPPSPILPANVDEHALWRSVFAAYPDSLLLVDQTGGIVFANPSAAAMLGYAPEELLALNVDDLVPDSIRPRHASFRKSYALAPRPRPMGTQMDLVAKRKDGSEVMVEIALSPLQGMGVPFVIAAIRDIGTYPRVRQALQRARYSEHLAQMGRRAVDERDPSVLLDHVPALAATALEVGVARVLLLEANRLAFRVASGVGMLPGEAVGEHIANRPDGPHGFALAQACPVVVSEYAKEERFPVPPAHVEAGLASALTVPISDRGRAIGLLFVAAGVPGRFGDDETRFLEALSSLLATSLQRAHTEEALQHAQRLESVGQLTGGIAHDFNNLLTVIQGNLQVLEELPSFSQDELASQLIGAAARATRRGAELTGKLLAFSRRQVLQHKQVDVAGLLNSLADMLRRTLDQRIVIEVDTPSCSLVLADPSQLESALLNIAINARDAMPDGGTLRFHCMAGLPASCLPDGSQPGDNLFVAIAISDTGAGMSEETKQRAFEPFFTTKEVGRGTGLGLSTVYGFVKQSKGAIAVDSTLGLGTTVTLYLPQPWHAEDAPEEAGKVVQVSPGLRVLLVEDDNEVRKVVNLFLTTLGCEVRTASSGEEALLSLPPQGFLAFDLLLTDIALGAGMRGTQLAQEAHKRFPTLAILLMSGYSSELPDADGEPFGWTLLRKPYSRAELAQALARATAGPRHPH